jgi:hypothetical protein
MHALAAGSRAAGNWRRGGVEATMRRRARSQNVHLKKLSFLAKSKIGIFACFFAQT